ncbi:HAD family hydrolase [Luteococcus sp. OSA5]|uniref:HAD family hydrolase n=1 Tax=Luteococcus sp. OSA5 TaxID=3401630 RepID=UPI003B4369E8
MSFDCGGVLLQPDASVFVDVCRGIGIAPVDEALVERAFAETVARVLCDNEPATYWSSGRAARSLGVALNIGGEAGTRAWSAVQSLAESGRSLWVSLDRSVPVVLEALKAKGYRLAVLSNNSGLLRKQLQGAGIDAYFSAVLDSQEIGVGKPAPRAFECVAESLVVRIDQCLHVGDDPYFDVAAATSAGMLAALYDRHGLVEPQREGLVFTDLGELAMELGSVVTTP